jgi:hypothetical protein
MGLDAFVRCRCWEDGKIVPPPQLATHVILDSEEDSLRLDLPWQTHHAEHAAFRQWMEHCCPHPRTCFVLEHISNWAGVRAFQDKLREIGLDRFPTLAAIIPRSNGGLVSPAQSAVALVELGGFEISDLGEKIVLIDADTGDEIHVYIAAYQGTFCFAPQNWSAGIDPFGYFIRGPHGWRGLLARWSYRKGGPKMKVVSSTPGGPTVKISARDPISRLQKWAASIAKKGTPREYFRSLNFRQEQVGPDSFRLIDEATGTAFITSLGVHKNVPWPDGRMQDDSGRMNSAFPTRLSVVRRKCQSDEFHYILRALRSAFSASIQTGNPLQWH